MKDWPQIWLAFSAYALVIAIFFALMFKHKHNPKAIGEVGSLIHKNYYIKHTFFECVFFCILAQE